MHSQSDRSRMGMPLNIKAFWFLMYQQALYIKKPTLSSKRVYVRILYGYHEKQLLFSCTALID